MNFSLVYGLICVNIVVRSVYSLSKHPVVIVIGYDAFRYNYFEKGVTPFLKSLSLRGTSADYVNNVFITKTYPNFFTISTGVYPEVHGVLGNTIFDPDINKTIDYSYELFHFNKELVPIWIANELAGDERYSGSMMWTGGDYPYQNHTPTYYQSWSESSTWEKRFDTIIQWIQNPTKPANLIMVYIEEPDSHTHAFGPDSKEALKELARMDQISKYLLDQLTAANLAGLVNIFFIADHGMQTVDRKDVIELDIYVDFDLFDVYESSPTLHIYPKPGQFDKVYAGFKKGAEDNGHFQVFTKDDLWEGWHYKNNKRFPPILLLAKSPYVFKDFYTTVEHYEEKYNFTATDDSRFGVHGYDNADQNMKPFFFAIGPNIKKSHKVDPFQSVDYYTLWANLLNISQYAVNTNGSFDRVKDILATKSSKMAANVILHNVSGAVIGVTIVFSVIGFTIIFLHRKLRRKEHLFTRLGDDSAESRERLLNGDPDDDS